MNIEVGDRVTYKYKSEDKIFARLMVNEDDIEILLQDDKEILKVERPNWTVVEEKKELLTEEEREFLKIYAKFNKIKYNKLRFCIGCVEFWDGIITTHYSTNNEFKNVELGKFYTLEELRIGGINGRRYKDNRRINKIFK